MNEIVLQSNININRQKCGQMIPHSQEYLRLFYVLKGTRSQVQASFDSLEGLIQQSNGADTQSLQALQQQIQMLLYCPFGQLYPISNDVVQNIHISFLDDEKVSPVVTKQALKALKAIVTITRHLTLIQVNKDFSDKGRSSGPFGFSPAPMKLRSIINSLEPKLPEDTIICRICDKHVRSDLIEEHTQSCMNAYKNETRIAQINSDMLDIQKYFLKEYLSEIWPGTRESCLSTSLPILHASILLNRAYEIDPRNVDSFDELASIAEKLQLFANYNLPKEAICQMMLLKQKVNDKTCASNAIRQEAEILRKTRIDASDEQDFTIVTTIADFQFIKRISSGAFARVYLARKKATGDIYAIKVQPKDDVIQKNQVKRVLAEKNILLQFNNPFIINFFMEYLPGGDLYSLLQNVSALDEDSAKTYTVQIANALGYLHSRGVIHRDIKPDNILVAANGTLRLTDFGLSYLGVVDRRVTEMANSSRPNETAMVETKSLVGTPDYIAPEIILNLPHTFTVDWWSLGIMLYEFIIGVPPFHGETIEDTRDKILKGTYRQPPSEEFSPECIDFIAKLLKQNPKERLGANGLDEVMHHPWINGIDISNREPPFIPDLKNELDTGYFEERYVPSENDDSDIFADMQQSQQQKYGSFASSTGRTGSSFLASSQSDMDDSNLDSDMSNFPSVAVEQLMNANRIAASHIKRVRASSFVDQNEQPERPQSQIISRSFVGLMPSASKRRTRRKPSFANSAFASTDDLANLFSVSAKSSPRPIPKKE